MKTGGKERSPGRLDPLEVGVSLREYLDAVVSAPLPDQMQNLMAKLHGPAVADVAPHPPQAQDGPRDLGAAPDGEPKRHGLGRMALIPSHIKRWTLR